MNAAHASEALQALVAQLETNQAFVGKITDVTDERTRSELLYHLAGARRAAQQVSDGENAHKQLHYHLGAAEIAARRLLVEQEDGAGEEHGGFV